MAWQSMASPAIFATIGDALPKERRAMGFTIQSMLKRIPMVISPLVGDAMIAAFGLRTGIRGSQSPLSLLRWPYPYSSH